MNKNRFRRLLIFVASAAFLIILITRLKFIPATVETVYSEKLFPFLSSIQRLLFNLVNVSLGDILYILVVFGVLAGFIIFLRSIILKKWDDSLFYLLKGFFIIECTVIFFYLFWGINYLRQPASTRFQLDAAVPRTDELKNVLQVLIDSANYYRSNINETDLAANDTKIFQVAEDDIKANALFEVGTITPKVKQSIISGLLNYSATAGYYNPFTGEAQINKFMPVFLKPNICLHELSHQAGIGAEDEANFTAFLTGINSKDNLTRYSVYYSATQEFLYALRRRDSVEFGLYRNKLSQAVLSDLKVERTYWLQYKGRIEQWTGIFYDKFLKANNQPEGMGRYNLMINLTSAWFRKNYNF